MLKRETWQNWVRRIVEVVPCRTIGDFDRYLRTKPEAKLVYPKPDLVIDDHWFSFRRYHDPVTSDDIFEVYFGSAESGEEYMGYDKIDPRWQDAEGRDEKCWELTRAYVRPRFRGRNYSPFMLELVVALAHKNRSNWVVAYPRHVAMLVTLLHHRFETIEGNYDETLHRILREGRTWYGTNTAQRRLYYAQEFRPFIQDGSFIMRRRAGRQNFWDFLMQKV